MKWITSMCFVVICSQFAAAQHLEILDNTNPKDVRENLRVFQDVMEKDTFVGFHNVVEDPKLVELKKQKIEEQKYRAYFGDPALSKNRIAYGDSKQFKNHLNDFGEHLYVLGLSSYIVNFPE